MRNIARHSTCFAYLFVTNRSVFSLQDYYHFVIPQNVLDSSMIHLGKWTNNTSQKSLVVPDFCTPFHFFAGLAHASHFIPTAFHPLHLCTVQFPPLNNACFCLSVRYHTMPSLASLQTVSLVSLFPLLESSILINLNIQAAAFHLWIFRMQYWSCGKKSLI